MKRTSTHPLAVQGCGNFAEVILSFAAQLLLTGSLTPHSRAASALRGWLCGTVLVCLLPSAVATAQIPVITMQPQSETVRPGASATFCISAAGTAPLSYLWLQNGVPIAGPLAKGPSYTLNQAQASDSGTTFSCIVSNASGVQASSNAVLIVSKDTIKIALVNPDYYRVLKCGEYYANSTYYSVANGSLADSGTYWAQSWMTNTTNWTGLGLTPDYLATVLTNAGYQVDLYWSSNFPSITSCDYNLVIVQDPLAQVGAQFSASVETNTPDVLHNPFSSTFASNVTAYYNAGGAVLLVGNAVRLLENGADRLNYDKQVLAQSAPNSVSSPRSDIPGHWLFCKGAPFCGGTRSGAGSNIVQQSSIVPSGGLVSQVSLAIGNDYDIGVVWCETVYHPSDGVSLLDVHVDGTAIYVLNGTTCSPPIYQDSVDYNSENFMGYTMVNSRRMYYVGSDAFFNLQFTDHLGAWHRNKPQTIESQIGFVGTNAILGLVSQAITPEWLVTHAAAATATVTNGFAVGATITDAGSGYTNTPGVRIIGGGGSGAEAVAVVTNAVVIAVNIINPGSNYTNAPVVVIAPPFIPQPTMSIEAMSLLSFTNLAVGTNYQLQAYSAGSLFPADPPFIASSSTFTQLVSGTASTNSYLLTSTLHSTQAQATAVVAGGFVVGAPLTSGGSGYTTNPAVTIVGNGAGSNATATAIVSGGSVITNIITDPGIGYINGATIIIAPPPLMATWPNVTQLMKLVSGSCSFIESLSPYDKYQLECSPVADEGWTNLSPPFTPASMIYTQYINGSGNAGFYRLQYVP